MGMDGWCMPRRGGSFDGDGDGGLLVRGEAADGETFREYGPRVTVLTVQSLYCVDNSSRVVQL